MKVLQKRTIERRNLLRYAMTERNILAYVKHPYIVSLHYAFQTCSHLVLVLQFCPHGNLQQLVDRERRLEEPLARLYSAEVLLALSHLHERDTVFRDLKPENIVIDEADHAMLTDFGLSKEGVRRHQHTRSFCGSTAFIAPEVLTRAGHTHTVDIYNLGVLLFHMLKGQPPYYHPDRETLFTNIRHMRLSDQIPGYVSRPAKALIEALMDRDPCRRLGAQSTAAIQEHNFFEGIDFALVLQRKVPVPETMWPRVCGRPSSPNFRGPVPENPFGRGRRSRGSGGTGGGVWRGRCGPRFPGGGAQNDANNAHGAVSGWEYSSVATRCQ
jgi:protein-serine/threonine kinase